MATSGSNKNLMIAGSVLGIVIALITIYSFAAGSVDGRIDTKLLDHSRAQSEALGSVKTDVAVLKNQSNAQQKQLDEISKDVKETQRLIQQLIRER